MKLLKRVHTYWCIFWFLVVFLLIYPFFVLFLQSEKTYPQAHFMNKIWAHVVFFLTMTPWKVDWQYKPEKNNPVVFAVNHTSYLDIPSLCLTIPYYFVFVGKSSLSKVPLFGYMFRKLYISVDRNSKISKYKTIKDASAHIAKNRSVAIFPEGTIPNEGNPKMLPFKDGPFRIAIENQVPLVPVTIPYNWYILGDKGKDTIVNWHIMKMVFHNPIDTKGMTLDDIDNLRNQTFNIIQKELEKHNPQLSSTYKVDNLSKEKSKNL